MQNYNRPSPPLYAGADHSSLPRAGIPQQQQPFQPQMSINMQQPYSVAPAFSHYYAAQSPPTALFPPMYQPPPQQLPLPTQQQQQQQQMPPVYYASGAAVTPLYQTPPLVAPVDPEQQRLQYELQNRLYEQQLQNQQKQFEEAERLRRIEMQRQKLSMLSVTAASSVTPAAIFDNMFGKREVPLAKSAHETASPAAAVTMTVDDEFGDFTGSTPPTATPSAASVPSVSSTTLPITSPSTTVDIDALIHKSLSLATELPASISTNLNPQPAPPAIISPAPAPTPASVLPAKVDWSSLAGVFTLEPESVSAPTTEIISAPELHTAQTEDPLPAPSVQSSGQESPQLPPAPSSHSIGHLIIHDFPAAKQIRGAIPSSYTSLYLLLVDPQTQLCHGSAVYPVFVKSSLATDVLKAIWSNANRSVPGSLTEQELVVAVAMIALAQRGAPHDVFDILNLTQLPLAHFDNRPLAVTVTHPSHVAEPALTTSVIASASASVSEGHAALIVEPFVAPLPSASSIISPTSLTAVPSTTTNTLLTTPSQLSASTPSFSTRTEPAADQPSHMSFTLMDTPASSASFASPASAVTAVEPSFDTSVHLPSTLVTSPSALTASLKQGIQMSISPTPVTPPSLAGLVSVTTNSADLYTVFAELDAERSALTAPETKTTDDEYQAFTAATKNEDDDRFGDFESAFPSKPHSGASFKEIEPITRLSSHSTPSRRASEHSVHMESWAVCLSKSSEHMKKALEVLNQVAMNPNLDEVWNSSQLRDYIISVMEMFRLGARIRSSILAGGVSKSRQVDIALGEMRGSWENMQLFLPKLRIEPPLGWLQTSTDRSNNLLSCGVCCAPVDPQNLNLHHNDLLNETTFLLGDRHYHATCANFYINNISKLLPALPVFD